MIIDIPEDERKQFQKFIQIFSKGKTILSEGQRNDQRFFLLRQGEVEILRNIGEKQEVIGNIEAVNFFGEMAVISHKPRSATVVAKTEPVVVYAFDNPNLSVIVSHPKWGKLLISRLIEDLERMNEEYEQAQIQIGRFRNAVSEILGTFLDLHAVAQGNETAKNMFFDSIPNLIRAHLLELGVDLTIPTKDRLDQYRRRGLIPNHLYSTAITSRSKNET